MNSFRGGGMQVHAVPDDERVLDSNGKPLPWGYSYADSSLNRKQPVERGPFGRPITRRGSSRLKTATPGTKEDPVSQENLQFFEQVAKRQKKETEERAPREQRPPPMTGPRLSQSQTMPDLTQSTTNAPLGAQDTQFQEPCEILVYGYPLDTEAEVITKIEHWSFGHVYEDYDRDTSDSRYSRSFSNTTRASIPRSLPREMIRKINTYYGGDHWLKLTLDSHAAADRLFTGPRRIVKGCRLRIERWRGEGPSADAEIIEGSAQDTDADSNAGSSRVVRSRPTSAQPWNTTFPTMPSRLQSLPNLMDIQEGRGTPDSDSTLASTAVGSSSGNDVQTLQRRTQPLDQGRSSAMELKPLKVRGATRMVLRPASEALLPIAPWSQRTFGAIPLVGAMFGGNPSAQPGQGGGIIGNAVPRRDDGKFDWASASLYWKLCWFFDSWIGTDLCGMKGDD